MGESGQSPTSKRLGPVDHTCQRKSCCEPNLRAMSQVETQTLLIGLSLWLAAKSKRTAADKDSLHVLNVGNDAWGRASFKGTSGLSTSRHDTIRGSSQRLGFRRKRVWQRCRQSNFVASETRRCFPELLPTVPIDHQERRVRGQAQKRQSRQP